MSRQHSLAGTDVAAGGLRRRSLFGFTLESEFAFRRPLLPADGEPDLLFAAAAQPALEPIWRGAEPVFRSPVERGGVSVSSLYRVDGREILHFDSTVDFELAGERIEYALRDPTHDWLVELRLLGPVMAYWMECRGLLCLHSSAVAIGNRVAMFVAAGGGGKTTVATALLAAGHALLSDDIVALEEHGTGFLVRPSYPEMRMWPETAAAFLEAWEGLPRVHPELDKRRVPVAAGGLGRFRDESLPLACVYLLERSEGEGAVEIQPVTARPALIELIARSFSPHLVEAAGLQPGRLDRLGRLVERVPVRRLSYSPRHDRMQAVAEAVAADLERAA